MKEFWRKHKAVIILLILISITATIYAATFKFVYTVSEVTLAQTAGFGGSDYTASGTINTYTDDIDLETNGYYGMWISVAASASGVTDDLVISYYASYDGTNFDSQGSEFWSVSMQAPAIDTASQTTFQMFPAPPHGRIGVRSSGTTDTFGYEITYIPARGNGT